MYQLINLYQIPCDSAIKSTTMLTDTLLVEFVVTSWKIRGQLDLRNIIIQISNGSEAVDQDIMYREPTASSREVSFKLRQQQWKHAKRNCRECDTR